MPLLFLLMLRTSLDIPKRQVPLGNFKAMATTIMLIVIVASLEAVLEVVAVSMLLHQHLVPGLLVNSPIDMVTLLLNVGLGLMSPLYFFQGLVKLRKIHQMLLMRTLVIPKPLMLSKPMHSYPLLQVTSKASLMIPYFLKILTPMYGLGTHVCPTTSHLM